MMRKTWLAVLLTTLGAFAFSSSLVAAPARSKAKTQRKGTTAVAPAGGPAEIALGHQLEEDRVVRIMPLIDAFNNQHKGVRVTLVRRAAGEAPKQLNLVTGEEQARFVAQKARFKPLQEVMRAAREPFDARKLSPELREGLTDRSGRLSALPLAFSTPVLYINKAVFRRAGLNPDAPPKTWAQMQETAGALYASGVTCPFTTSWPVWVFIDNLSAWDGVSVSDAKGRPAFNGLPQIKHIAMMASWAKAKYFSPSGRRDEGDQRFASGECAMLTSASSLYPVLLGGKMVEVGVSALPYHDDVYGAPKNTLADGASLWVADKLKPAEVKGVAKFVSYLLSPEVQINMTAAGGFLPLTPVARATASSRLLNPDMAALRVADSQLRQRAVVPRLRPAQVERMRIVIDEELEAVWANRKPAKEALDSAVARTRVLAAGASAKGSKKRK